MQIDLEKREVFTLILQLLGSICILNLLPINYLNQNAASQSD